MIPMKNRKNHSINFNKHEFCPFFYISFLIKSFNFLSHWTSKLEIINNSAIIRTSHHPILSIKPQFAIFHIHP